MKQEAVAQLGRSRPVSPKCVSIRTGRKKSLFVDLIAEDLAKDPRLSAYDQLSTDDHRAVESECPELSDLRLNEGSQTKQSREAYANSVVTKPGEGAPELHSVESLLQGLDFCRLGRDLHGQRRTKGELRLRRSCHCPLAHYPANDHTAYRLSPLPGEFSCAAVLETSGSQRGFLHPHPGSAHQPGLLHSKSSVKATYHQLGETKRRDGSSCYTPDGGSVLNGVPFEGHSQISGNHSPPNDTRPRDQQPIDSRELFQSRPRTETPDLL